MKLKAIIVFAAFLFAACNAVDTKVRSQVHNANVATPEQQASDGIKRISTAELAELMKDGKVVVVDVRNQASWDAGHIRGAKWISVTEIANRTNELPKDKQIVTYCS